MTERWKAHRRVRGRWVAVIHDGAEPHRWQVVECRCRLRSILLDLTRELFGFP